MIERQLGGEAAVCGVSEPGRGALPSPPATSQGCSLMPFLCHSQLAWCLLPPPPFYQRGSWVPSWLAPAVLHRKGWRGRARGSVGPRVPEETSAAVLQTGSQSSGVHAAWSPGALGVADLGCDGGAAWSSAPEKGLAADVQCRNCVWRAGKADARVERGLRKSESRHGAGCKLP